MNQESFVQDFLALVGQSKKILITSHKNPDDDSIGSVLATYQILKEQFPEKEYQICYTTAVGQRYSFLDDFYQVKHSTLSADDLNKFDLLVFLDLNRFELFDDHPNLFKDVKSKKICIDHHATAADEFDLTWVDADAVSCTQVLYQLFYLSQKNSSLISSNIAKSLFLGIYGDSGSFQFIKPGQAEVFQIAYQLIKNGKIDIQRFASNLNSYPKNTFTVIQEFVKNARLDSISGWPPFVVSYLSGKFTKKGVYTDEVISNASHIFSQTYLTSLLEAPWGVSLHPDSAGNIHISLRSRPGSVNVRSIVEGMAIGGGHDLAAGGIFKVKNINTKPSVILDRLKNWLRENSLNFIKL